MEETIQRSNELSDRQVLFSAPYYLSDIYDTKEVWKARLKTHKVRLQWDPDHNPKGAKLERKAIQLGLRDGILHKFNNEWIRKITDITEFVKEQHQHSLTSIEKLIVPVENILRLGYIELEYQLGITNK